MGTITGFKDHDRKTFELRPEEERVQDSLDVYKPLSEEEMATQASRCMDCGTTFCSWGCPLGNLIPYWNEYAQNGDWKLAYASLSLTSNFPEFTGRICPGLCESSCSLGVNRESVSIREIEHTIIEKAFEEGWVKPRFPKMRTGKRVAVIGSGPAGLAAADELNSVGHEVVVYEKNDEVGGLLRYGIPNFKLEKNIIDRRVRVMEAAGVEFSTHTEVGSDVSVKELKNEFDALVLTGGSTIPRDLAVEGRELEGVHFAVDYLTQHTMKVHGKEFDESEINAKGKVVLVIGGGDTGSDCIGTAVRQGAKAVYQFEILPKPKTERDESMPWPTYPRLLKTTSSHKEGCERRWLVTTKSFKGENGKIKSIIGADVQWLKDENGRMSLKKVEGSEFEMDVDQVFLAMGFLHPQFEGMVKDLGLDLDPRGNLLTDKTQMTNQAGIFSAGDMRQGQSLVVKAIHEGRKVAKSIDVFLMGESFLRG